MRYEVVRPDGEPEGLLADEWEIHETGALIFSERHSAHLTSFVICYAAGAWISFYGAEA